MRGARRTDGIVTRRDYQEVPPRMDYTLTPLGHGLAAALAPLCEWGSANMAAVTRLLKERARWPAPAPAADG